MNMRWLIGNFTDPHYNVPRKEQMRLSNVAHKRHLSTVRFLLWTLIVIVAPFVLFLGFIFPWIMGSIGFNSQSSAYWGVLFASIFIIFWPWSAFMYRALYVKPIRRAMRESGSICALIAVMTCGTCPKQLKNVPNAECGARRC